MRIVIDTNVLVSGLLWHGPSNRLWNHVLTAHAELFSSQILIDEFAEVIERPKFKAILARASRTSKQLLSNFRDAVELVVPAPLPQPVSRDADDDHVIAAALAAQADWIVTGDQDLLVLGSHDGIAIVTPAQALQMLEAA